MKGDSLMKEIQIKNFRSLKDTGLQKLSPITVLVGENSSGKSTFLRAFPLLKQSISKRTSGPILWAGDVDDYVDFGSFEETVTNDGSNSITFGFKFNINEFDGSRMYYTYDDFGNKVTIGNTNQDVFYEMTICSSDVKDYVSSLVLTINNTQVHFDLEKMSVNTNGGLFYQQPNDKTSALDSDLNNGVRYRPYFSFSRSFGFELPDIGGLFERITECINAREKDAREWYDFRQMVCEIGAELINNGRLSPLSEKKDNRRYSSSYIKLHNNLISAIQDADNSGELEEICKLFFIYKFFMSTIDEFIYEYFKQVHYIAPLRATAERYYRLRNLAVDEVDYQGKNLPIFINSLTSKQLKMFQSWTNEHFGFSVSTDKSRGHLSLQIQLSGSDKKINLSDTGFGYSQVLPIITQLWELSSQKRNNSQRRAGVTQTIPLVIAIEQPELHLHPAVQARLAKAFIACIDLARKNKCELQLLIETHSETIVNYFGRAIARGMLKPEDVSVIMFEKGATESITAVKNSSYDRDGFLLNWPYGFFDSED